MKTDLYILYVKIFIESSFESLKIWVEYLSATAHGNQVTRP